MSKVKANIVIANAAQIITCREHHKNFEIIEKGWLAVGKDKIIAIGQENEIKKNVNLESAIHIDATGKVVAPGFIDCHTHAIFGGSRVDEYAATMTCRSKAALESLGIELGVMASVHATRNASNDTLYQATKARVNRMLRTGTTTVEIKSGYGLNVENEIRCLEVIKELKQDLKSDIIATFLGAHGWPPELSKDAYIDLIITEMLPIIKERNLAEFCDVWIEDSHFNAEDARQILQAGIKAGLKPKLHTDAYSYIKGSDLAAEMRVISADHLNYTPIATMKKLADAGVIGVVMPSLDFAVAHPRPFNARKLLDNGVTLALATNLNPGNWTESLQFVMVLACRLHGFSPEEAIWSATMGGALALNLAESRGSLEVGKLADIQIWDIPTYPHIIYRLGNNAVETVIKSGRVVVTH